MATRKRTPRKTPPGTKPLPRKISEADLAARQELQQRAAVLERAKAEIEGETLKVAGRWEQLREMHGSKYQMSERDTIDEDGTIRRNNGNN
jgi:hypothetical protein